MTNPFHLAIPVTDLVKAAEFYQDVLGCERGRASDSWIDFNLFGHQLVCHYVENGHEDKLNPVDGDEVPVPHFGVVLNFDQFDSLIKRFHKKNQSFVIEPKIRFAGQPGEQRTMFLRDPSGNALEFKAFKNLDSLFKS
tara:strand:+ start:90 stop:503 length:414 start_codon:yes stop_codon:yes gene_type:complete